MSDPKYWQDKWKDERVHSKALEGEVRRAKEDRDHLRALNAEMREALQEFDEFAWTAVTADCEEARQNLQRKIDKARAILAQT